MCLMILFLKSIRSFTSPLVGLYYSFDRLITYSCLTKDDKLSDVLPRSGCSRKVTHKLNTTIRSTGEAITPFAVYYAKIRIHLRETATNSTKVHLLVPKNNICAKLRFNNDFCILIKHLITYLDILLRHSSKRKRAMQNKDI